MKILDYAWNSKAWDIFEERHANTVIVFGPGQPEPTSGLHNHRKESEFFKIFPDNHLVNNSRCFSPRLLYVLSNRFQRNTDNNNYLNIIIYFSNIHSPVCSR